VIGAYQLLALDPTEAERHAAVRTVATRDPHFIAGPIDDEIHIQQGHRQRL
jgi:hypothetical protein